MIWEAALTVLQLCGVGQADWPAVRCGVRPLHDSMRGDVNRPAFVLLSWIYPVQTLSKNSFQNTIYQFWKLSCHVEYQQVIERS